MKILVLFFVFMVSPVFAQDEQIKTLETERNILRKNVELKNLKISQLEEEIKQLKLQVEKLKNNTESNKTENIDKNIQKESIEIKQGRETIERYISQVKQAIYSTKLTTVQKQQLKDNALIEIKKEIDKTALQFNHIIQDVSFSDNYAYITVKYPNDCGYYIANIKLEVSKEEASKITIGKNVSITGRLQHISENGKERYYNGLEIVVRQNFDGKMQRFGFKDEPIIEIDGIKKKTLRPSKSL